ncbi:MAG: hypothetical protein ACREC5_01135 [Thermoplasmata archaeon]
MGVRSHESPAEDRHRLLRERAELEGEVLRLTREEEYLTRQIRRAEEQLRYYDRLLADLKHSAGRTPPLHDFVRRMS